MLNKLCNRIIKDKKDRSNINILINEIYIIKNLNEYFELKYNNKKFRFELFKLFKILIDNWKDFLLSILQKRNIFKSKYNNIFDKKNF